MKKQEEKQSEENEVPGPFDSIAEEIHKRWYEKETKKGNPSAKVTFKEWKDLPEETRESNRAQARDILRKLGSLGYTIAAKADLNGRRAVKLSKTQIDKLARMEHERWNEQKIANGWTYGKIRNDALKIHDCLLPWDRLTDDVKKYDIDAVEDIPEILGKRSFVVVKEG